MSSSPSVKLTSSKKSRKTPKNQTAKSSAGGECILLSRPCILDVYQKVMEIKDMQYALPKTANKGKPGNYLEQLTGIPTSSECLDCTDGEVKVFPLKQNKRAGELVTKETIAVTMINKENLKNEEFTESKCYKKMTKILYIPYLREGDNITYMSPTIIDLREPQHAVVLEQLKTDYDSIRKFLIDNNTLDGSTSLGKYLQNRTKGAGKDAPKTRAFYLRTQFMKEFVNF